jgi:hypothetical protein
MQDKSGLVFFQIEKPFTVIDLSKGNMGSSEGSRFSKSLLAAFACLNN